MASYLNEEKHHFPYTRFELKQPPFLQIGSWLEKQVPAFIKKYLFNTEYDTWCTYARIQRGELISACILLLHPGHLQKY